MDKANSSSSSNSSSAATSAINGVISSSGSDSFGAGNTVGNSTTTYNSYLNGMYITSAADVNWDYLDYYVATLDRYSPEVNYKLLKENNLGGVIIEAGYLYNAAHVEQYYRNPKIHEQCMAASQADVPFGLYCDCKARSIDEAKKELYQLSFCIRKYPPVLGMWVHFQLVKSKSVNDSIVDYYKKYLILLGLKGMIGILATEKELETISYKDKHEKDWELWLNKHVNSVNEIETLLDPTFFSV